MEKRIYRDFNDWWANGKHGWSSVSIDIARETWDDFAPTIEASRDEYKNAFIELMKQQANNKSVMLHHMLEYIQKFKKDDAPNFMKWWSDQE